MELHNLGGKITELHNFGEKISKLHRTKNTEFLHFGKKRYGIPLI